jgi:hypothetical protein
MHVEKCSQLKCTGEHFGVKHNITSIRWGKHVLAHTGTSLLYARVPLKGCLGMAPITPAAGTHPHASPHGQANETPCNSLQATYKLTEDCTYEPRLLSCFSGNFRCEKGIALTLQLVYIHNFLLIQYRWLHSWKHGGEILLLLLWWKSLQREPNFPWMLKTDPSNPFPFHPTNNCLYCVHIYYISKGRTVCKMANCLQCECCINFC